MPWVVPVTVDDYLELIRAIDRTAFAVHLDPVNMIDSPRTYFNNGDLIRDCFQRLGPYIEELPMPEITALKSPHGPSG